MKSFGVGFELALHKGTWDCTGCWSFSGGFDPFSSSRKTWQGRLLLCFTWNMATGGVKEGVLKHGWILIKCWVSLIFSRSSFYIKFEGEEPVSCSLLGLISRVTSLSWLVDWNMVISCWTWSFSGFEKPWPKLWSSTGNGFRAIGETGGGRCYV